MPGSELDTYEAIEAAVKETACGRAFLAEHALRARQSDTVKVLAAIERLEQYWLSKNITGSQEELPESSSELPLIRTDSMAEGGIETTGGRANSPGKRTQTLSDESILWDIAKALEAP
jgi:hypothetical protein